MQDIVLLHGALGSARQFDLLKDQLKERFKVHTINFSGHGGTAIPADDFSIPLFANEVKEYLEQNNIASAHFFGYSMGGYVALYLAHQFPEVVVKVITLATKFYWNEDIASREIKMLDPETISQKLPAFAEKLKETHYPENWRMVLEKTREMLKQLGKQNTLPLSAYKSIDKDCLLLLGDKDKMVGAEETIAVSEALPYGSYKILPETPHPFDQVDHHQISRLISDFIKGSL